MLIQHMIDSTKGQIKDELVLPITVLSLMVKDSPKNLMVESSLESLWEIVMLLEKTE